ncbi:MAG TPA: hypothetical protein VEC36_10590 [Patescibacteria group bacterium]|nr:hypothetical protein [Patescibacteria group bacterium]
MNPTELNPALDKQSKGISDKTLLFVGFLPACSVILSLGFYFFIALKVGHLPSYENPQPADFPEFDSLIFLIVNSFAISMYSIIAYLICLVAYLDNNSFDFGSKQTKTIIISCLGSLLFVASFIIPVLSDMVYWIFD